MTEKTVIKWILVNLGPHIEKALEEAKKVNPDLLYTKDWLAGIAYRETGFLIARYVNQNAEPATIHIFMRGDYGQRSGDKDKIYHGYGYWQIDIASFPAFVKSGDWIDPLKTCAMAISVLEGKRKYLQKRFPALAGETLHKAIT